MVSGFKLRFLNLILRSGGLGIKFVALILSAKILDISDYAKFSLVVAGVALLLILIGFEVYQNTLRKLLLTTEYTERVEVISNHISLLLSYSFVLFPLLFFVNFSFTITSQVVIFILFFEYMAQELGRITNALKMPIVTAVSLFMRSSMWGIYLILNVLLMENDATLIDILYLWMLSSLGSTVYLFSVLYHKKYLTDLLFFTPIKLGLSWLETRYIINFFIASLLARFLSTADKYYLSYNFSDIELAIYSFHYTLVTSIFLLLDPLVLSIKYPLLIESWGKSLHGFKIIYKQIISHSLIIVTIGSLILFLAYPYLMDYINKDELSLDLSSSIKILLSVLFLNFSVIPGYVFMCIHDYRANSISYAAPLFILIIYLILFPPSFIDFINSILISSLSILTIRFYLSHSYIKRRLLNV